MLLDTMVPRQRVNLQFQPPVTNMLTECRESGRSLAILGMNQKTGKVLRRGVEGRIESMSPYRASHGFFSSHSTTPMRGFTALDTTLVGGRRFEITKVLNLPDDFLSNPDEPFFTAEVRWLREAGELAEREGAPSAAIAVSEALGPLVSEWIELVRSTQREREDGQLDQILLDLGGMPDAENVDDRAFWTVALINPIPAMGVAREVRANVLEAKESLPRVEAVHAAIVDSIKQMRERPPGTFEVEPMPIGRRPL